MSELDNLDPSLSPSPSLAQVSSEGAGDGEEMASLSDLSSRRPLPYVEYLTGAAGTGKTYELKRRIEEDRRYGILCSTTGISAINLGAQTINSTLKYFDTASLKDNFINGRLQATLRKLALSGIRNLVIDEISMMAAEQLDLIHMAVDDVNQLATVKTPMGIIATGDFLQLPPVKATWAFRAECWPRFAANTIRLSKVWRQSDPQFLNAINFLRAGDGQLAAQILKDIVPFHSSLDEHFDGTTIMGRNDEVDRYNRARLMELPGKNINLRSRQWGNADNGAWKNIPVEFSLKEGALVMLRSNSGADLTYANGDNGHIREFDGKAFHIELLRNGEVVKIWPIHRTKISREAPSDVPEEEWEIFDSSLGERPPYGRVSYDEGMNLWHVGGIQYYPIVASYATTVHRSQGLSLDRVQIDIRNQFLGSPGMEYVAISRCRSAEGLRIVGTADLLAKRCATDPEVRPYI